MAQKSKEEKEAPRVCVCGSNPVTVKYKRKYMVTCPDTIRCAARSRWHTSEQAAIKEWNNTGR